MANQNRKRVFPSQDSYLASAVNELEQQMRTMFGEDLERHFKDAKEPLDLVIPGEEVDPENATHPVFGATWDQIRESEGQGFPIMNQEALKTYREQLLRISDSLDQDIDTFVRDRGESGQTLATITKARSSGMLKNSLAGWNPRRVSHEVTLFQTLNALKDYSSLSDETLSDIEKSKEGFPIYQSIASGYEAVQTSVDYLDAKEKGTLTAETENELRAKLYKQLSAAKAGLDIVKDTVPGTQAYEEKSKLLATGISDFSYGSSSSMRNAYADVEARLAGVENGWPIEDLTSLSLFNAARHSLITQLLYDKDGRPLDMDAPFLSPLLEERNPNFDLLDRMNDLFTQIQNTAVFDHGRRRELLGKMSGLLQEGVEKGVFTGRAYTNAAEAIRRQANATLSPVVREKLGINDKGQYMYTRNEGVNLAATMKNLTGGNFFGFTKNNLTPEEIAEFTNRFNSFQDNQLMDRPDMEKFDRYRDGMLRGALSIHPPIASIPSRAAERDGQVHNDVEEGRELTVWMGERYRRASERYQAMEEPARSKYKKIKEYYEAFSQVCDPDGNYLEALTRAPYLANLTAETTSTPKFESMTEDEIIEGLDQDPEHPLFEAYMDIVMSGLRETALEYRRQKMERRGFTEEDERAYLRELRQEHERNVAAFDKIWAVNDQGQYDRYINNPLRTICGKKSSTDRDICDSVGMLRAEIRAIDNGWGSRDLHLFGYIGVVEQQIARFKEQYQTQMQEKLAQIQDPKTQALRLEDPEAYQKRINNLMDEVRVISAKTVELTTFAAEFNEIREKAWNKKVHSSIDKAEVIAEFAAFKEKYKDFPVISRFRGHNELYQGLLQGVNQAAGQEVYQQMKECVANKDYRELTQMMMQIDGGTFFTPQAGEISDAMNRFLTELSTPGPDGLIPAENAEILGRIARQVGSNLIDPMLRKADELTQMEEKIRQGQVPGTESLLDYKNAGRDDNREMIRDVASNFVDQTSTAAKEEHNIRDFFGRLRQTIDAAAGGGSFRIGDETMSVSAYFDQSLSGGMSYLNYQNGKQGDLTKEAYDQKIARASEQVNDITQHGFEINPEAKEGESIFNQVPEDVKNIGQAQNAKEVEATYNKALDDGLWIAGYRVTVMTAAAEAKEQLRRLEQMTRKSNSAEYDAMHDTLKAIADLGNEGELEKKTPAQVEKAFDDLRTAGGTYERTHQGFFKGNIGTGRQRYQFSQDIQVFAEDRMAEIARNTKGIDPNRTFGQQERNRRDAIDRTRNVYQVKDQVDDQVKDVSVGSLEQKLDVNAGNPRIDYAALRAKMNRMQQGVKKEAMVRGGMSA